MAESSQLSRYRPAVLAVTGLAAVAGIYAVYTSLSHRYPPAGLTRKRAVRGRPRQQPEIHISYPDADSPLGTIVISKRDATLFTRIGLGSLPSPDDIRTAFGPCNEFDLWQSMVVQSVHSILETAKSVTTAEQRSRLRLFDLEDLAEAILVGNRSVVEASKANVAALLDLAPDDTRISLAFTNLLVEMQESAGNDENRLGQHRVNADNAQTESPEPAGPKPAEDDPSQGLKALLYYIAEEDAKRKAYEHRGINCEECGILPIRGVRWHCLNCPDFDLCSMCEAHTQHTKTHTFAKIKVPLPFLSQPSKEQPIWYAGDPRKMHPPLDIRPKRNLCVETEFELPQIDAFYDQFCNTANVPWPNDPLRVEAAINRRAFNKAFTSERWPGRFAPNTLYDRMFAFYDSDNNGLIGFTEFVHGLAYCRGPKRFASLDRALQGYDIDGDGYVDRNDFLRLLRAKYDIQKLLITSIVQSTENEQTIAALEHLKTSQPISAVFTQEDIPPGEDRPREGKRANADGDMLPRPGVHTILDDNEPWPVTSDTAADTRPSHETLRHHLSRFEEMLHRHDSDSNGPVPEVRVVSSSPPSAGGQPIADSSNQHPEDHVIDLGPLLNSSDKLDDIVDRPFDPDILWHIAEVAFNEVLDGLFSERESVDADAQATVDERRKWQEHIDRTAGEKLAFEQELDRLAKSDPLMATALEANKKMQRIQKDEEPEPAIPSSGMMPTDEHTLTKMENNIAQQPLADLLSEAGYSIDEPTQNTTEGLPMNIEMPSVQRSSLETPDPTLPHNRPNKADEALLDRQSEPSGPAKASLELPEEEPPSKERLEHLLLLEGAELDIQSRGGPGRLSYDEVEKKCRQDSTKELRGLVLSWLEWASF